MAKVRDYDNAKCLKCKRVLETMYAVGPMIFCPACFNNEFFEILNKEDYTVPSNSDIYREWLKKYSES